MKELVELIDEVNKKLISELQRNGRMPVSQISDKLGMSNVAVKKRLDKLLKGELINVSANLNVEVLKAKIAVLLIEVKDLNTIRELASSLTKCPRTIFFSGLMASSLLALVFGEDLSTLESIVGTCVAKGKKGIMHSEVYFVSFPIHPKFLPIKVLPKKEFEKSPCGMKCDSCECFKNKLCLGCPSSKYYRGPL